MADDGSTRFPNTTEIVAQACKIFEEKFKIKAKYAAAGPGRVNLIGEHTDYNDGFVFPMVS